ncbi:MAG: M16 family metallopeptidase [Nodosilinea sp.]
MPLLSAPAASLVFPKVCRFPNGLTVIAEQMPLEVVNLSLWLRVGSAVESDAINGMAHFLEHMVFKGTNDLGCGEFERRVEERGALTNAATSQDYTKYYITTAPQDFAALAPLQIQLALNPRLSDDDFERERPVILEEIRRAEDNPQRRTHARSMELGFERLPYRRPVLGPTAVIEHLTPGQMRDFHQTWYRPQNMTAVAVGNLPVDQLVEIVAQGFDQALHQQLPQAPYSIPAFQSFPHGYGREVPFQDITRVVESDPTLTQARLILTWRVPGITDGDDTYALDILASVLGRGRTSRLVRDLRENRHWVSSIGSSNMTLAHQGLFIVSAKLEPEYLDQVEGAIADHVRQLIQTPVSLTELRRVQTQVANQFVFANETPSERAGLYGYYHTLTGDIGDGLHYPERIQALTVEDLQTVAQRYLCPDAYGLVVLQPA